MSRFRDYLLYLCLCTAGSVFGQSLNQEYKAADDPAFWVLDNIYRIRTSNLDTAEYYLGLAIEHLEARQDPLAVARGYKERGIVHYYQGEFDLELADLQKALQIADQAGETAMKGDILKELALTAKRQGDIALSKQYGRQAVRLCALAKDETCLSSAQRNLGRIYLQDGPRDSAVYYLEASYALKRKLRDSVGVTYALNDMAELAAAQEDYDLAIGYLRQSASIRKALSDSTGFAISINNIGEMYFLQGKLDSARLAFEESLILSTQLKYLNLQQHTLNMLGEVYTEQNNYEAAYKNLQLSKAINDSLYSVEKANAIAQLEAQFDTEKKEQTILVQAAAIRAQRLTGLVIILGLLLIGLLIYYRLYQQRKYERRIAALSLEQELHLERERISRDLHDSVGSNLTRMLTDIDLLGLYHKQGHNDPSPKIKDMRQFAQQTIGLLRETIWALHQEAFTTSELANRLTQFLDKYLQDRMEWRVERCYDDDRTLTPAEVLNILRILQEATQNMLKHSDASEYQVKLEGDADHLVISIQDDGKGFSSVASGEHYGLKNMQQRAMAINAGININSEPGKGTNIQLHLHDGSAN